MNRLAGETIIILGAGPTGLGATHRLAEIGVSSVQLFEQNPYPGGLSASFVDPSGFTWDIGGHIQFSHYKYFDNLMDDLLGDAWIDHARESWVWMRERFIPYPLQNNIHLLPRDEFMICLTGLIQSLRQGPVPMTNFKEWIDASFGVGLAELFMHPYNYKVWAHPLDMLSPQWVGERVAQVDLARIVSNALEGKLDCTWGPNNQFRFPVQGGTGKIWTTLAGTLPQGVFRPSHRCVRIEASKRLVHFDDGSRERYDHLISTIPLDVLVSLLDVDALKPVASNLRFSTVNVIGVGLRGAPAPQLKTKCWMYFPEADVPFYRATVFSNYSPHNVPDITRYWSLMLEVSESPYKLVDRDGLMESVLDGLVATRLIESRNDVVSVWSHRADHGYPTPFLGRDGLVEPVVTELAKMGIYSRGRFGGWKYEVSNQDHSLMQGVEVVNNLAFGAPEVTYWHPNIANGLRFWALRRNS
jgi:protoporphyrinogen oxidase